MKKLFKECAYLKELTTFTSFVNNGVSNSDVWALGCNKDNASRKVGTCFDNPSL